MADKSTEEDLVKDLILPPLYREKKRLTFQEESKKQQHPWSMENLLNGFAGRRPSEDAPEEDEVEEEKDLSSEEIMYRCCVQLTAFCICSLILALTTIVGYYFNVH
ncbi:uncharacterized protein LOC111674051 [Orussus abietinus]|uniref:uncharacterized protein LOC111674051 n=1 Tax=Orussus abietinus TaxID=222816 RepID=UPI000C716253|nr:uncharacterized protein LOC111674051 [Orussus abietinus]